jgi:hypothetical protein
MDTVDFKDLDFGAVEGLQIIAALNKNVGLDFADGDLYQKQQDIANEARTRGLLINPNPYGRTGYGNTSVMRPSVTGWEQTKGIQRRVLDIPVPDFVDLPVVVPWWSKHGRSY